MDLTKSSRFKDAPWFPKEETNCIIGGAGGIGSWLAVLTARAGYMPIVYDYDTIEEHNLGGQMFPKRLIGETKVKALALIVKDFTDMDILPMNEKYTIESMCHTYMFSAFDNMKARKDMFDNWKSFVKEWEAEEPEKATHYKLVLNDPSGSKLHTVKLIKELTGLGLKEAKDIVDTFPSDIMESETKESLEYAQRGFAEFGAIVSIVEVEVIKEKAVPIFIDGRLTMEQLQIFCVTPDKIAAYEEHLFDDADVPEAPCTLKQTSHSAAMIAAHMVGFFTNHFANNMVGEKDRIVPFMWEYFIPIDYLNVS